MSSVTKYSDHETEKEAREAGLDFIKAWPPFGYDSSYQVWRDAQTGRWMLRTHRYSSCD